MFSALIRREINQEPGYAIQEKCSLATALLLTQSSNQFTQSVSPAVRVEVHSSSIQKNKVGVLLKPFQHIDLHKEQPHHLAHLES